jgi:hypothetical protein
VVQLEVVDPEQAAQPPGDAAGAEQLPLPFEVAQIEEVASVADRPQRTVAGSIDQLRALTDALEAATHVEAAAEEELYKSQMGHLAAKNEVSRIKDQIKELIDG